MQFSVCFEALMVAVARHSASENAFPAAIPAQRGLSHAAE